MPPQALNLLVFRETQRRFHGPGLKSALVRELAKFPVRPSPNTVLAALLRAGELECAAADADPAARAVAPATDSLAEALLQSGHPFNEPALAQRLADAAVPNEVWVSPPEGFAYYALHPLAFADAVAQMPELPRSILVAGIRSIGTTLSAVAAAAARKLGLRAQRFTVRPSGHPYNRRARLLPEDVDLIRRSALSGAAFLVVDEGPGLSGSSFLSVAEALEQAGAPREKIILLCGHLPDFDSLRADDGSRRARRFRWAAVSSAPRRPAGADLFIGGGAWRSLWFGDPGAWPASWINLERLKYLSPAPNPNRKLFKFLGFAHYGQPVCEREEQAAATGFGPLPRPETGGFASYDWLSGCPMSADDLCEGVLKRLAEYCAFRAHAFAAEITDARAVEEMAKHNLHEMGIDLPVPLAVERPAVCDGRMQPYEWLLASDGRMLKTDSGSHGDDHFFPGPTDIAWDLAGAIVEWSMNEDEAEFFLDAYRRASGDDARHRITSFTIAYTVFRLAYSRMAANALASGDEEARHRVAAAAYDGAIEALSQLTAPQP